MPSTLQMGYSSDGIIVRVVGQGTMVESPAFRAVAEASLDSGVVIFDAARCDYLDSTFLGCLVGIQKSCEQSRDRRFVIAASSSTRIKLFSTTSLDQYFEFVESVSGPVKSLETIRVDKLDPKELGRHVMQCHRRLAGHSCRDAPEFKAVADRLAEELGEGEE